MPPSQVPGGVPGAQVTEQDFNIPKKTLTPSGPKDLSQHEQDLLTGPLMQELGVNIGMVLQKLKYSLPGLKIPQEVSSYPEMMYAGIILVLVFLISIFSRSKLHSFIPLMFGTLIYGSLMFKILTNLLLQGEKSIDLYLMMSAICYSLTPVLLVWTVFSFYQVTQLAYFLFSMPSCICAAYILQKHVAATLNHPDVQVLIIFPAILYSAFWMLMGRGIAK